MNDNELTNSLIFALNNSSEGFKNFKTMFNDCANAFELGNDAKGLKIISELIQPLQDFCYFCADILSSHAHIMDPAHLKQLESQCEKLQTLMGEMLKEMEDGNFVEVGDILKYDMGDLTLQMSKSFPELASSLQKS